MRSQRSSSLPEGVRKRRSANGTSFVSSNVIGTVPSACSRSSVIPASRGLIAREASMTSAMTSSAVWRSHGSR